MTVKTGQQWSGLVVTKDATGALATPSVGPAGVLYVDGTSNGAGVTISGSNPYKWTVTLPALTAGQCVSMYITATIATIATASVVAEDVADTKRVSDLNDVGGTAQTGDAYAVVSHADYGNAKLVRSTTPANTLDVSATGEAGVDWSNVGSPTTTVGLSGTTVKTATDIATALEDIGTDGVVLATTQPAVTFGQVKILADVADEGALHVVNSNASGRGQYNYGGAQGLYNHAFAQGQVNEGNVANVVGVDSFGIRAAVGLAAADLDTQLAALPTAAEIVAAIDADPPAVLLAPVQGGVTFGGQVKIVANVGNEGALHIRNTAPFVGNGIYAEGQNAGQYNRGVYGVALKNEGGQYGQINQGSVSDVEGVDPVAIRDAIGMAAANLDAQLAALPIGEQLVEGQYTRDDLLRLIAAALVGLTSGSGTDTVVFTGLDGTTARITATVSNEGNRTQMVLDGEA